MKTTTVKKNLKKENKKEATPVNINNISKEAKENEDESNDLMRDLGIIGAVSKQGTGSQYHTILARQLSDFINVYVNSY